MIRTIIETGTLLYAMAAVGMLGILCQLIISRRYKLLIREASDTQLEKRDFMKQLRYKFRMDKKRSNENVNIPVFVRRSMCDYRFMRMTFHQWKRLAGGLYIISMAAAAAGLIYCFRTGLSDTYIQNVLWTAGGVTAATVAFGLWTDLPYKASYLQMELEDYFFHSGAAVEYQEAEAEVAAATAVAPVKAKVPSVIGIRKKKGEQVETKAQREKRELKTNLAKLKDGARETAVSDSDRERNRELLRQMDSKEQERIIRDVLADFLA